MKLFYIFLGIAIVALAGTSFYYTNIRKEDTQFKAATSTPKTELIYLYREYGDVSFKNKSATTFTQVADTKISIDNYATVKTEDGRAYVIFPDNSSITLSTSTEIEISYEPTKVSIMQILGSTYHRVTSLATGNKYEIRTPNTLAAIRGTKLAVSYNPKTKRTFVAVTEHRVEVNPIKEDGTVGQAPVMVQEGSLADILSSTTTPKTGTSSSPLGSKMIIRSHEEVKDIKPFLDENKVLDKEFNKAPRDEQRQLLEKIINALHNEKQQSPDSTGGVPQKKESRADIITRIIKQSSTETQPKATPSTTQQPEVTTTSEKKTEIVPTTSTTPTVTETTSSATSQPKTLQPFPTNVEELTPEQEAFIDLFYTTYEKYFYVDDPTTYCKKILITTAQGMMSALLEVTNKAGYTLPKQSELTLFATDLITSCKESTMTDKAATYRTRFDITYPY